MKETVHASEDIVRGTQVAPGFCAAAICPTSACSKSCLTSSFQFLKFSPKDMFFYKLIFFPATATTAWGPKLIF